MIAGGVPLGTSMPDQVENEKPGTPASATVGTGGSKGVRAVEATASGTSLPASIAPSATDKAENITCTCPP